MIKDEILDSTGIVEISCFLEKEFDIQIPDEDYISENFENIKKIVKLIEKLKLMNA